MKERGAALLEVLIALALTAMMAAALSGVTGFGLSALERAQAGSTRMTEAIADRRKLSDALTRMTSAPGQASLTGTSDDMIWHGLVPAPDGSWVPAILHLRARDMQLSVCDAMDAKTCEVLASAGFAASRFDFAGPDGVWQADWAEIAPPSLIRIQSGDETIIAAPRITGGSR